MEKGQPSDPDGIYEELEMLAMLRQSCELVFRSSGGARTVIRDRIGSVHSREGRNWFRTAGGLEIGLEQLEEINGIQISKNC